MLVAAHSPFVSDHSHSLGGHAWRVGVAAGGTAAAAGSIATMIAINSDVTVKAAGRMIGGAAVAGVAGSLVGYALPPGTDPNGGWSAIAGAAAGGLAAAAFGRMTMPGLPLTATALLAVPGAVAGLVGGVMGSGMRRVD
jgi:hypothetical protein